MSHCFELLSGTVASVKDQALLHSLTPVAGFSFYCPESFVCTGPLSAIFLGLPGLLMTSFLLPSVCLPGFPTDCPPLPRPLIAPSAIGCSWMGILILLFLSPRNSSHQSPSWRKILYVTPTSSHRHRKSSREHCTVAELKIFQTSTCKQAGQQII